jgi:hypothetical protein
MRPFFCSVQLLTISSSMTNPLTPVCQQQAAAAEQVHADRDGGERGPTGPIPMPRSSIARPGR